MAILSTVGMHEVLSLRISNIRRMQLPFVSHEAIIVTAAHGVPVPHNKQDIVFLQYRSQHLHLASTTRLSTRGIVYPQHQAIETTHR